jgi:hypothetical protein
MKKDIEKAIQIDEIRMGRVECFIVGTTPLYMHRFGKKAQGEILLPSQKMNQAEKAANLKHDPIAEFRECIYMNRDSNTPTAIHLPTGSFGKAIANAAIDIPGANKSQMQRLTSVSSTTVFLYGVPRLDIKMVRQSDQKRTPDMRTRPLFPEWACSVEVDYVASLIKEGQVVNLLAAAGILCGIGDCRPQRGGSNGKFKIVSGDDLEYLRIVKHGSRKQQIAAINDPQPSDDETEYLMRWFEKETKRREKVVPSSRAEKVA